MSKPPFQNSLFETPDNNDGISQPLVAAVSREKPKDKQQAAFQRLIKQIHEHRSEIETWQAYALRYNQLVASELMPLHARLRERRIAMAHLLNEQFHRRGAIRGKRQRHALRAMILDLTRDLLQEEHDEALVALHDRHSDFTHAEAAELNQALSRDIVENLFDVRLADDANADSIEDWVAQAMRQRQQEEAQRAEKRATRRKSAKTLAAEEKRAEAEKAVSQSVREVYRKLASALHPDRPCDALGAEQKTALMQRVNRAYDSGNLLELLNIQLEIEQIDAEHLSNLSTERVAHYVQVLREQLDELKSELRMITAPYRQLVPFASKLQPVYVDMAIKGETDKLNQHVLQLEDDLLTFTDPGKLAAALKDYVPEDNADELAALSELLNAFGTPGTPPRRKR